jgi:hypothetical protein
VFNVVYLLLYDLKNIFVITNVEYLIYPTFIFNSLNLETNASVIKDEVLLIVGCTIFPMYLFKAKYLFTGSFRNRSIDI